MLLRPAGAWSQHQHTIKPTIRPESTDDTQGFRILKNGPRPREQKRQRLVEMRSKRAHLPTHRPKASARQHAHHRAREWREQAGNGPRPGLTGVFSSTAIPALMPPLVAGPVRSDQREQAHGPGGLPRKAAESRDPFTTGVLRLHPAGGASAVEAVLPPRPLLAKPVVQIRAAQEVALVSPSLPFVPPLSFWPAPPTQAGIDAQIDTPLAPRGVAVPGAEEGGPSQPLDLGTPGPLPVPGLQGEHAPGDVLALHARVARAARMRVALRLCRATRRSPVPPPHH